jgi:tetratricopeptide (TPR) repeat protein
VWPCAFAPLSTRPPFSQEGPWLAPIGFRSEDPPTHSRRGGSVRCGEDEPLAFSLKRKSLDQAQKYVQKGAYDKALKEYQKHLQTEPGDTNARLKLGDLHLKRGDQPAAIEAYNQVAEQFSKGGFDAKAVAIFKQILKIDSSYLDARIQLGDHFQRMGLASDALREFQAAVKTCQERGLKREAFDLLKRVAALDPGNIANRLSLADLLQREKLFDEAKDEYLSLLVEVQHQGDNEACVRVAERLVDAFPENEQGLVALAQAQQALGDPGTAVERLKEALASSPESVELREAAIAVYEASGNAEAVRTTYREIAELYKRRGDHDAARDILQRHVPVAAFSGEDPDSSPSLVLSEEADEFQVEDPPFDTDSLSIGDLSDEVASDIELVDDDPADSAEPAGGVDELMAEARVSLEFDDPVAALKLARKVLELEPGHTDAKKMVAQAQGARSAPPEPPPAPRPAVAKPVPAAAPAPPEFSFDDSLPDIELVLEDEDDSDDEFASIEPPTHVDLAPLTDDLLRPPVEPPEIDEGSLEELDQGLDEEFEIEFEAPDDAPPPPEVEAPAVDAPVGQVPDDDESWAAQSSYISENLEQAEFFFQQGMLEEAERAFREVLERSPHHPQALVRIGELEAQRGGEPGEIPGSAAELGETYIQTEPRELGDVPELDFADEPEPEPAPEPEPVAEPEPELDIEPEPVKAKPAKRKKASKAKRKPAEPEPLIEEPEPVAAEAEQVAEPEGLGLDLGAELADELEAVAENLADETDGVEEAEPEELIDPADFLTDDEEDDEDPADFDLAAALDDDGSVGLDMNASGAGFEQVFKAFKKGIQEQLGEDEVEAHYDLAIAYKEMGLLDDAVEELELVRRSEAHRIEGLSLMATCKIELGRPQEAAGHLAEALAVTNEGDESVVALRYDLGEALLAAGKRGEALDAFQKVAAANSKFRDVQERVEELAAD